MTAEPNLCGNETNHTHVYSTVVKAHEKSRIV